MILPEVLFSFTFLIENCDEKLYEDQKVVALLNSLSDRYGELRNALEYEEQVITVDIIISALRNKEFELKTKSKYSKFSKGLYIREKLNQKKKKKNNLCNFNSDKKENSQKFKFRDKNKNQVKFKNQIRKCYYFGKT